MRPETEVKTEEREQDMAIETAPTESVVVPEEESEETKAAREVQRQDAHKMDAESVLERGMSHLRESARPELFHLTLMLVSPFSVCSCGSKKT